VGRAPAVDWRPLVVRTSGSAAHGVYGLVLATSVIAVSSGYDASDAGRVAMAVLVTAVVFWLAHVYAAVVGGGVSDEQTATRAAVAAAPQHHWSLVEVTIPLVLVLGLGAVGVVPDRAAIVAATVVALVELAATGAYGAIRRGAGARGIIGSGAMTLALGLTIVMLKAVVH
jgi:hypothetical protein